VNKTTPVDLSAYTLLLGETRQQPMNIGSLLFYRVPGEQSADDVAAQFADYLLSYADASPPFNYRLVAAFQDLQPDPVECAGLARDAVLERPGT